MQLTPHFNLREFTRSSTAVELGLSNEPGPTHLLNLRKLAASLEEVRALLKAPMIMSSVYRSPPVNTVVGGSNTSDHPNGLAGDFTAPRFGTVRQICEAIAASDIKFDQLIYEQRVNRDGSMTRWVHIGIGSRMRRQVMSWISTRPGTYVSGIVDLERQ